MNLFQKFFLQLFFLLTPWAVYAQGVSDFYQKKSEQGHNIVLRAGINYSFPIVSTVPQTQAIRLGGILPRYGLYVGGAYYKAIIPNQLSLRVDATLQQKGLRSESPTGQILMKASFFYLGVNPQIGLHLYKNIIMLTGLEANQLIRSHNTAGKADQLEIGTTLRLAYMGGRFGAEIGYFKSFNKFSQWTVPVTGFYPFDLYNQNVQIGILYKWTR
jgi:hypothetical protein